MATFPTPPSQRRLHAHAHAHAHAHPRPAAGSSLALVQLHNKRSSSTLSSIGSLGFPVARRPHVSSFVSPYLYTRDKNQKRLLAGRQVQRAHATGSRADTFRRREGVGVGCGRRKLYRAIHSRCFRPALSDQGTVPFGIAFH
jgi:hypothetical protein